MQARLTIASLRYRETLDNKANLVQQASHTDRFAYFVAPVKRNVLVASLRKLAGGDNDAAWRSVRVSLANGSETTCVQSADWPQHSFVATAMSADESRIAFVLEHLPTAHRKLALADVRADRPITPADIVAVRDMPPHVVGLQWLDNQFLYVTYGRDSPLVPDAVLLLDTANHAAVPLFVETDADRVLDVQLTQDRQFVLLRSESHRNTEYRLAPANRADALRGFDRVVFPRQFDSRAIVRHEHRRLWIAHDVGRLRGRIDQLDSLADDAEFDWRNRVPVIASLPQLSIDFFDVYQRHLLLYTTSTAFGLPCVAMLRDFADLVLQRIAPHALTVTAPQRGTHAKEAVFFSHPLFTAQQRAHTVNLDTLAVTVDSGVTCRRDGKLFDIGEHVTVEHHTVTSRNGVDVVEVPMIIVRAHDTPVDGTGKCLQLVYGAYGDTWPFRLGFVELEAVLSDGWTLALCGVRGGGELGSNWADEGSGEKRDNSFIDAAACGKWLIQRGYAARDSLCIGGRSAGAFVAMGAVAREPTLYAVLIGIKPLVDPGGDGSQLTATDLRLWGSFRPLEVLPLVAERVGGAFPSIWMHATAADEHAPVEAVEALVEALYDEELGEEEMHMRVRFRPAKNGAHDEAESREVLADLFAFATMEVARRRELKEEQTTALER